MKLLLHGSTQIARTKTARACSSARLNAAAAACFLPERVRTRSGVVPEALSKRTFSAGRVSGSVSLLEKLPAGVFPSQLFLLLAIIIARSGKNVNCNRVWNYRKSMRGPCRTFLEFPQNEKVFLDTEAKYH